MKRRVFTRQAANGASQRVVEHTDNKGNVTEVVFNEPSAPCRCRNCNERAGRRAAHRRMSDAEALALADRLDAMGRHEHAELARGITRFGQLDDWDLQEELARSERLAAETDGIARDRHRRRVEQIANEIERRKGAQARQEARSATFDFVKPVLGGHAGESVLDGE